MGKSEVSAAACNILSCELTVTVCKNKMCSLAVTHPMAPVPSVIRSTLVLALVRNSKSNFLRSFSDTSPSIRKKAMPCMWNSS